MFTSIVILKFNFFYFSVKDDEILNNVDTLAAQIIEPLLSDICSTNIDLAQGALRGLGFSLLKRNLFK